MTKHTLSVCSFCRFSEDRNKKNGLSGGEYLIQELEKELEKCDWKELVKIKPASCMAACLRSCTATLAGDDKLTYIFSQLAPVESAPELLEFIEQYITTPEGKVPYRERSRTIKQSTAFILPSMSDTH